MKNLSKHQPKPKKNKNVPVWDLVIKDMKDRDSYGKRKHGEKLRPFNNRNALVDAYQEALDLVVYLRQAIYEREKSLPQS